MMIEKARLFLISNLVAASLLTAACAADSPAEDPVDPGVGEPQVEVTTQVEEPVVEATTQMGEAEEPVVEATTEAMGETEEVAEATTEAVGETEGIAGAEATTEAVGETESVAGTEDTGTVGETDDQMAAADMSAAKASVLIGHAVRSPQGEDIGEIEDLVIGLDSDQIKYAVLSFGGFLDIGDKLFAIPVQAFQFDPNENVFVLNVTEEQLENAPGFETDNWPDTAAQDWDAEFREFQWSDPMDTEGMTEPGQDVAEGAEDQDAAQPGQDVAEAQQDQDMTEQSDAFVGEAAVRASEILDFNIEDVQGEEVGEIEDIIVELDTGNVQYVVVELNDEIDNSEDFFGLQLSELNFNAENDAFVFDPANQSLLQNAPSFNQEEWDNQFNLELGQATQ
jgi:sporulation protein YlmC with PRC-barrel domain